VQADSQDIAADMARQSKVGRGLRRLAGWGYAL
jgi:hypothetical protein